MSPFCDTSDYERAAGEPTLAYYLDAAASRACLGLHRCTIRDYQPWTSSTTPRFTEGRRYPVSTTR